MTNALAERRRGRVVRYGLIAGLMAAVAFVTVSIDARSARPDIAQGLAVPGLEREITRAQRILVTSTDASYRIERTERGWVMRDRGDYPVSAARLEQLTNGLARLAFTRRMTSDQGRHARLGVDDPRQGGRGVLVQIEDGQGALLANLILGVETRGLYVRKPDENQVWAARGELPPLRDPATWLDLTPLTLDAAQIARAEIVPTIGRPYVLERESRETRDFVIVAPARLAPLTLQSVTQTAERLAHLSPVDVQPAPAIQGTPRARVRLRTFTGVLIDAEIIDVDQKSWVKITATAENPEAEPAAAEINNASAGWAYALSPAEAEALTAPLTTLLPQPAGAPEPSAPPPAAPPPQAPETP